MNDALAQRISKIEEKIKGTQADLDMLKETFGDDIDICRGEITELAKLKEELRKCQLEAEQSENIIKPDSETTSVKRESKKEKDDEAVNEDILEESEKVEEQYDENISDMEIIDNNEEIHQE